MKIGTKKDVYRWIVRSVATGMVCAALFFGAHMAANAWTGMSVITGTSTVSYSPRYLPNIIQGANGPADMIFFLYKYLMGLVGIVAVGVIMYAGVLYTVSADPGKIKQSNELIKSALKGIVLLFGAQVLFNTINPNIVDFPRIQSAIQPKVKFVPAAFSGIAIESASSSATAITAAQTAQGAVNLYGGAKPELAAKIQPCNDCASLAFGGGATFQRKEGACFGAGCQINKGLISTLNNLQTIASANGIQWRMTEGYPPTVDHISSCHFDGTCVDIGLTGGGAPTAARVNAFINAAQAAGLTVVNEYPVGASSQHFDTTTGGHLHVRQ